MGDDAEMAPGRVAWLRPRSWRNAAVGQRHIRRERLFERLSRSALGSVVLLCAPAGSGKSVLLQSWIEAEDLGDRVAWVSVERGERDGQRFWLAVSNELAATVGGDSVVRCSPAPGLSAHLVVGRLLTDLHALDQPVVLVLDDLHELDSTDGLECLERFLRRVPAQMLVVLGTRVEPRLGLHRLRVAGALTEIRGPDLRFSLPETRELLEEAGITVSDSAVARLHDRTEGWAAGLRLAAITLAGHPDPERFVAEFCGSDRRVSDYLLAEVLDRQTPEARDLLLRTSALEHVSGPLADVLTGGSRSERILQSLEDHNAFVTALDAGRSWFRYHHLFADLLARELRATNPAIIGPLHRTAARWYEPHGYLVEAIRHAQAGEDWPYAVRMLADHFLDLTLDGRAATTKALLAAFPSDVQAADAELAVAFAGASIMDGAVDEGEVYLDHAERLATGVPEDRRRRFDLRVAGMRVWLACWRGDLDASSQAMRSLQAALAAPTPRELAHDNDVYAMAVLNLGTAELWASQLEDARSDLQRALTLARRIPRPYLEISCLAYLGIASVLNGSRVSVQVELADEAIAIAESNGWGGHPVIASALVIRGIALVWLGRFEEAERLLDRADHTLRHDREPGLVFLLNFALGLLCLPQGRHKDALGAFGAAEEVQRLLASGHALGVELQCRLVQTHLALGDSVAARARLHGIDPQLRDQTTVRVTEALLCLAEGRPQDAVDVVAPGLERSDDLIHLQGPRIQALVCDAVARDQLGDSRAAEASLDRALELAGPDRLILPFMMPPARELLKRHSQRRTADPALLGAILEVLAGSSPPPRAAPPRPDELSPAELRVLSYLPSSLTADEIAAELYLSANTVRTHLRHIYAKLDAHNRGQAVSRARELGLLTRRSITNANHAPR